jgi:hypothetical protein
LEKVKKELVEKYEKIKKNNQKTFQEFEEKSAQLLES